MGSQAVLITGANRGLGSVLVENFLALGWRVFSTARQPSSIIKVGVINNFPLDLSSPNATQQIIDIFDNITSQGSNLNLIIHVASPYTGISFINATTKMLGEYANCQAADQMLTSLAMRHFSNNNAGVFIFTGAILARDNFFERGLMTLLKHQQRMLTGIANLELRYYKEIYFRYLNIGTFREDPQGIAHALSEADVANKVKDVALNPKNYGEVTDVMSSSQHLEILNQDSYLSVLAVTLLVSLNHSFIVALSKKVSSENQVLEHAVYYCAMFFTYMLRGLYFTNEVDMATSTYAVIVLMIVNMSASRFIKPLFKSISDDCNARNLPIRCSIFNVISDNSHHLRYVADALTAPNVGVPEALVTVASGTVAERNFIR